MAMAEIVTHEHWPSGSHPLAPGVQMPGFLALTQEVLEEIVRRITANLHPEKIILFGSYAYGQPSSDSDLDLLVVMESEERPAGRFRAVSDLLCPRPFPMDILVRTPQEIAEAIKKSDPFITEIFIQGKVLYDRPD